jgi:hypothetical protein
MMLGGAIVAYMNHVPEGLRYLLSTYLLLLMSPLAMALVLMGFISSL